MRVGARAYGRIVSWEGASLWVFEAEPGGQDFPRTDLHAHHAVQVTLALKGHFELATRSHALRHETSAAVASDTPHTFHQGQGMVAHLFVAPESRAGRAMGTTLFAQSNLARLSASALDDLRARFVAAFGRSQRVDPKLIELGRELVSHLAQEEVAVGPDRRVERVMEWATRRLDEPLTLEDAAQHVGLSRGRLRHLFVAQTGLPFRVYLLWLRMTKAVEFFAGGSSLTDSAYAAGFSDSAHFSRTFRRMYGIPAASLRVG